ncbi:MAG: glycosyltransferase family 2 protein [Rhodospirillales bacterium]|nr:glycosyltransferase family 2 protein [Rhodospirillales bacterium]
MAAPSGNAEDRTVATLGPGDRTAPAPSVSIVIPARDEEAMLPGALTSALAQDYMGAVEIVVADGSDGPAMADAVRARFPEVRLVANPDGGIAAGLNRAIAAAAHDILVRCDARCVLPADYVRRTVATLERTGAACVGGVQRPVGTTPFARAVAIAMTTPLGAGGARYRMGGPEGPTDTVFLGAWRRATLDAVGGFDDTFGRNEDYELAWRLRVRGGRVWLDPALNVDYRPRESFAALATQYFGYGRWKAVMLQRHPRSLRPRQLAAPALVLGLASSIALAIMGMSFAALVLPVFYLAALTGDAALEGWRRRDPAVLLMPAALAAMHLAWGAGFWRSWSWAPRRRRRTAA